MTVVCRPARASDASALARLHARGFDRGWPAEDFTTWLERAEAFAIIAESGGEPTAFGLAVVAGDDAELLTIATAAASRRSGLGRRVLRELDAEAARRGVSRWVLEVARNNSAALGLYLSEGFVEIGRRPNYYSQPEGLVDAIMLARPTGLKDGHGLT